MNALEVALLISKNQAMTEAILREDEDTGYQILFDTTNTIKLNTGRYIKAQVITKDKNIFARSWDNIYAGMPLGDYREDLDYFNSNHNPRVSIEVGRRIGIKATVPLYKDNKLIGFVEVIDFFESMTEYFASIGIDLYVLMDNSYLDVAILMQNNLMINNFIVSNINYNPNNIQLFKKINLDKLKAEKIELVEDKYIVYNIMRDGNMENIGGFVMVVPKEHLDYFANTNNDISFLLNITKSGLYNIAKHKDSKHVNFIKTLDAKSAVKLQDIVSPEDKELFEEEAYAKLNQYPKDDLIKLLLDKKIEKKIEGKIR
jgi:hypothetical protein